MAASPTADARSFLSKYTVAGGVSHHTTRFPEDGVVRVAEGAGVFVVVVDCFCCVGVVAFDLVLLLSSNFASSGSSSGSSTCSDFRFLLGASDMN